jgi:hypothetical protein
MRARFSILTLAILLLPGCGPGKLDESRNWELEAGEARALDLPAISKPQKINVDFTSSEGDVSAFVFKEEDAKGEDGLRNADTNAKKAIASKTSKGETFSVDVPENTATRVIVFARRKTTVTLKVKN